MSRLIAWTIHPSPLGPPTLPPLASATNPTRHPAKSQKSVSITKREHEAFVNHLPKRHQLIVDQNFGKPSLDRCFQLEASFPLVLLPLYHSGYLTDDDQKMLAKASQYACTLIALFDEYNLVNFRPLRE
jgi:hypothetical protein